MCFLNVDDSFMSLYRLIRVIALLIALVPVALAVNPVSPNAIVATREYDAAGRTASVTNAFGTENAVKTVNVYDQIGRTVKIIQDAGGANESATSYAHDANGNLIEQTDATGRKVKYAYDALNRRISVLRSRWALFLFLDYHMK